MRLIATWDNQDSLFQLARGTYIYQHIFCLLLISIFKLKYVFSSNYIITLILNFLERSYTSEPEISYYNYPFHTKLYGYIYFTSGKSKLKKKEIEKEKQVGFSWSHKPLNRWSQLIVDKPKHVTAYVISHLIQLT